MVPRKILLWSIALAAVRLFAFYVIYADQSHDAQWQLSYLPLWVADFPVSVGYIVCRLPIPLAEAVIGPLWWFFVPIIVWSLFHRNKITTINPNGPPALVIRQMKNIARIRVPSVKFASERLHGKTIYRGIHEFTHQVSQRLRDCLTSAGVGCSAVRRSFKPMGSFFLASSHSGTCSVIVCVEREVLPIVEITISADPVGDAVQVWTWFEPLFRRTVETEFPNSIKWMTIDEDLASGPSV